MSLPFDTKSTPYGDYVPTASQPKPTTTDKLYSDIREQEEAMAGLIEQAKREGLDGRLIAMANTDFERGFMALDKALTGK